MARKKDYSKLSKDELIAIIDKLEKKKKYGLVWDAERVPEKVVLDCKENLPILTEVKGKEIFTSDDEPTHILIEGDNYHALSVLNYTHRGKIDVIYIDPPYNTGAKDWKYNNKFVDETDSFRHSKWLQMMSSRLEAAKNLLAENGIICVTIDDNELPRLWLLLEQVFGETSFLGTAAIRINPGGRKSKRKLAAQHEYALFFALDNVTKVAKLYKLPDDKTHTYIQDEDGNWYEERNLRKEGADSLAKEDSDRYFPIYRDPKSGEISSKKEFEQVIWPLDTSGNKRIWRRGYGDIDTLYRDGTIFYKETRYGPQIYFRFKGGLEGETPKSFWEDKKYSASEHGTQTLDEILGEREKFPFPKSPYATADCIRVCSDKNNAIVLDFFAGSGTTLQSVLELNRETNGSRQCILVTNNEEGICDDVTYPRVRNVIKGYRSADKTMVDGHGNNLRFFRTAFVKSTPNLDQVRINITKRCTEMLCLREGVFRLMHEGEDWKIFEQGARFLAVYYNFVSGSIVGLRDEMNKLEGDKVLYCFTVDPQGLRKEDFADWQNTRLEAIPQKILDVYKQLFKDQ